jgi:capsular exopolysaccharide synthesis family protein
MENTEIDIRGILGLLWRQKRLIAITILAVVGLTCVIVVTLTPVYSAGALILVDTSRKNLLNPDARLSGSSIDTARIDSEVEILKSENIFLQVTSQLELVTHPEFVAKPGLPAQLLALVGLHVAAPPPTGDAALRHVMTKLRQAITVQRRGLTNLIAIHARSEDPQLAAALANTMASAYIADQIASKIGGVMASHDILQNRMLEARREIVVAESAFDAFIAENIGEITRETGLEETALRHDTRNAVLDSNLSTEMRTRIYELQQQTDLARLQYQALLARIQDLQAEADLQIADSRIVSTALPRAFPSFPSLTLILSAMTLGALGLGIGLAFFYENFVGGFATEQQVESVLKTRVAAAVPRERAGARSNSGEIDNTIPDLIVAAPLSAFAEAVRRIRAGIDQCTRARQAASATGAVIMVTSAEEEEGKSTLALSLARSYAISGQSTLLIDCDMRRPSIHRQLGIEPNSGLVDYLTNDFDGSRLGEILQLDSLTHVSIIVGARRSEMPTDQFVTGKSFARLIEAARNNFDIVILDTPPIGPVVDGLYLAQFADVVAFVIRWASTSQTSARRALAGLEAAKRPGTEILAILNQQTSVRRYRSATRASYLTDIG